MLRLVRRYCWYKASSSPKHLLGIDEVLESSPLDKLLFVALPAGAVNEVVIQGSVFVRMLQVQSAGFDPALNVQKEQGFVEGDPEFPILGYLRLFLRVQKADRRRLSTAPSFSLKCLMASSNLRAPGSPWKVSTLRMGLTRF